VKDSVALPEKALVSLDAVVHQSLGLLVVAAVISVDAVVHQGLGSLVVVQTTQSMESDPVSAARHLHEGLRGSAQLLDEDLPGSARLFDEYLPGSARHLDEDLPGSAGILDEEVSGPFRLLEPSLPSETAFLQQTVGLGAECQVSASHFPAAVPENEARLRSVDINLQSAAPA
jgi:hypothetical protein